MKQLLHIEGMGCQHCVDSVTEILSHTKGVSHVSVELENNCAIIETDTSFSHTDFVETFDEAGYELLSIETM